MYLTIIETGLVPEPLRGRFRPYPEMFATMLARHGAGITPRFVPVLEGAPLPDPAKQEAVLITGSPAGVYDPLPWMNPLRDFIRQAHESGTKMVGICFGHQIIADALGGDVRKSEKGWGLGRHVYDVMPVHPHFVPGVEKLAIACSHQDQVIAPPPMARVILRNEFAPNAGLVYAGGKILSFQPHPEFEDDYASALIDLRRGKVSDDTVEAAHDSMKTRSDSVVLSGAISRFLTS
ncbi:type 1 glutamine amidotransferase [Pelagibacterium flavum]|uniref:Type 1 glutamine amidotransferase n=1 Tax=Pelagibacterium flavum TaxID=2984530 RepID=A0ABY6IMI0_9HYPH|nr:type 1 glutamine amidotransferase [Pelagibacterium sp. YIM 151497]UYQ71806.1 type 1 glutamine amidotransferase [Pelagibacterium sp. YIM 151497]